MQLELIKSKLQGNDLDHTFELLVGKTNVKHQKERYLQLVTQASSRFKADDFHLFSAPGRTEIGGNHTDHQRGRVLAASVNMDIAACVTPSDNDIVFESVGFDIKLININDLSIHEDEYNTSEALIRGTCARFKALGYKIGGFKCFSNSDVLKGSGISSSAAFEVLIGTILSHLYNEGTIDPIEIAKIGQYAENQYFNKPCGLMDQMACSVGGFVSIDFKDVKHPIVEKIDFDFEDYGYHLVLVDTKGDHANLSDEYGLMPQEMKEVAKVLGCNVLSETSVEALLNALPQVRAQCNDRAILRAIHFFNETNRVVDEVKALKNKDINTFRQLMIESGHSSNMYLQNIYSPAKHLEQNIAVALAVSAEVLKGEGAYRVHGGGLAGTIQALVPFDKLELYKEKLEALFGKDACFVLKIRPVGGYKIV